MAPDTDTNLPPLGAWQAATLRLTAFLEDTKLSPDEWWSELVETPPDSVTAQPKLGQHQQAGMFEGRKLVLQTQPERVDWALVPAVDSPDELTESIPVIGPFPEALTSLEKIALAWLNKAPSVTRLAFGAVLVQPVGDRRSGYLHVGRYLPNVILDPDGSSDFSYQINRPRDSVSGVTGLKLNRLTKWSVMLFQRFRINVEKTEITSKRDLAHNSACRLELDINTSQDYRGTLPHDLLPQIFQELVSLAKEIVERGDLA